jgi:hypothetical protein
MHQLRGELLTYNYLHILLDAIYMIQDDLENKDPDTLLKGNKCIERIT